LSNFFSKKFAGAGGARCLKKYGELIMNAISVENVSFNYPDKAIIKNLTFTVEKGDFLCIVGTNGAGKSTLLKLILNLLRPESGKILIDGEDSRRFKSFYKISYVSQNASAFNSDFPATVEEVVSAGLYPLFGFFKFGRKKEKQKKVLEALETVGMEGYSKRRIGFLSGGQKQRVLIAKALVNKPDIIFLDEPTVGIDVKAVDSICCLLGELNKRLGITIVMVTHDISSIIYHSNKILRLSDDGSARLLSSEEFGGETIFNNVCHDGH